MCIRDRLSGHVVTFNPYAPDNCSGFVLVELVINLGYNLIFHHVQGPPQVFARYTQPPYQRNGSNYMTGQLIPIVEIEGVKTEDE